MPRGVIHTCIHKLIYRHTHTHITYILICSNIQSNSFPLRWVLSRQTLTFYFPNKLATSLSPYHVNSVSEIKLEHTCGYFWKKSRVTYIQVCVWCANVWMETRGQHQVFSSRYACLCFWDQVSHWTGGHHSARLYSWPMSSEDSESASHTPALGIDVYLNRKVYATAVIRWIFLPP